MYNGNDNNIRGDKEPSGHDNAPYEEDVQQQNQSDAEQRVENPADPVGKPQRQRRLSLRLTDYILY